MARSAGRDLTPSEKWDKQYDEMIRSLLILGAVFLFAMMVIRGYGNRRDPEAPIILMPGKEFGNPKYTTPHVAPGVPIPVQQPQPIMIDPNMGKKFAKEYQIVDDETGATGVPSLTPPKKEEPKKSPASDY